MKIIDTHVHLGNIYQAEPDFPFTGGLPDLAHPEKANTYEQMGFGNIYLGRLNYFFKPLVKSSAYRMTRCGNLANLQNSMDKHAVDFSVVLALEPFVPTEKIIQACGGSRRLIPFCSVHPSDKEKKQKLARYIKAGCRGLKIHPVIQQAAPDAPETLELIEEVAPYNIPILLHCGWGSIGRPEYGSAKRFKKILDSFKHCTFIFAHMGFYEPHGLLEMIRDYPNVYTDTSWQPAGIIKKALNLMGEDRIMLGTDWPFSLQNTSRDIILKITRRNPALQEKILYKNAARLLKL